GACPFSVWIGKLALKTDIRLYGDGNPGAYNVFRAGGRFWGVVRMLADILKGMPFILIARLTLDFPQAALYTIALFAVLGHAFSPFLRFRGGKALAVAGGTMLALPLPDMVISYAILMFIGFLLIDNDAWTVMFAAVGSLVYLVVNQSDSLEIVYVSCLLLIFFVKHLKDLKTLPHLSGRFVTWLRSRKRAA
ncbi:MAG: glycerol-3-phosphate acyltransferase, partial [Dehalococcoidia bacterium]|nr:glycerol-3-phosphate acyltransferase [Dehalococcoidia bacterium]